MTTPEINSGGGWNVIPLVAHSGVGDAARMASNALPSMTGGETQQTKERTEKNPI